MKGVAFQWALAQCVQLPLVTLDASRSKMYYLNTWKSFGEFYEILIFGSYNSNKRNCYRQNMKFIIIWTVLFFSSCYVPHIPLTSEEKEYKETLTEKFFASVTFYHDWERLRANQNDGAFWIQIKNSKKSICEKDSTTIKKEAINIAKRIYPILSHKEKYVAIDINFTDSEFPNDRMERILCECATRVFLNNLNLAIIVEKR